MKADTPGGKGVEAASSALNTGKPNVKCAASCVMATGQKILDRRL